MAASGGLERHWGTLRHLIAGRVGDLHLAADITQEAYSRMAERRSGAEPSNPKAYLFAIATNLVADHFRRSATRSEVSATAQTLQAVPDTAPLVDAGLLSREALSVLRSAIDELPPRTREVFVLHKFDHLAYADIAVRLGISRNTVMVHMTRALSHCREALRHYHRAGE